VTSASDAIEQALALAIGLATTPATGLQVREELVDVLTRTQKLIVFMTDLEVREQVGIEAVVPVVLTDDEMVVDRATRMTKLDQAIKDLQAVVSAQVAGELTEKLQDSVTKLVQAQSELLLIEDYKEFVALSDPTLALAADSLRLVEQQGVPLPDITDIATSTTAEVPALEPETATSSEAVEESEDTDSPETVESELEEESTASTTEVIDSEES